MPAKLAKADITPVRQRTQYTCMSASMSMCLQAHGHGCDEDEVNKVMGARPMQGATWEQALACAQHYGMRGTLTSPCTLTQLKAWTDAGTPVIIAWNPEGREWSHASVVFDVDDEWNVHVADPNIPDPEQTVRVVSKAEFYNKWYEKWPKYLVRRPAMAIEREVTPDGRQVMASDLTAGKKERRSLKDRGMSRFLQHGPVRPTEKSDAAKAMSKAQWEARKEEGRAGLPGAGLGAGYHKDKSRYDRGQGKSVEREAGSLTQPLMTRRDYGVTASMTPNDYARALKVAVNLPDDVERYHKEVSEGNPDYTEEQAWATAWSIYCRANPGSDHCHQDEYFKAAKFPAGQTMTIEEVAKVVGPEFKEMNENPPPEVVEVREEMQKKAAQGKDPVWIVRDPSADSEMADILYRTTVEKLPEIVIGTGASVWRKEDTAIYLKESDAKKDAEARMAKRGKTSSTGTGRSPLIAMDAFAEMLKTTKFEKGKSMTVDEVAKVVGPEFKEMNEDPPASVVKVREEMQDKTADSGATLHRDDDGTVPFDLFFNRTAAINWTTVATALLKASKGLTEDDLHYRAYLRAIISDDSSTAKHLVSKFKGAEKARDELIDEAGKGKTAAVTAGGKWGFTKGTETACTAGVNKLAKAANRIASSLYAKDEGSVAFLQKHAARAGSKTASMLLKAMENIGPAAALKAGKTAGKSGNGLYGFTEKTAKLGLDACSALHHEAGVIAADLFARKGADPVKVAGYLAANAQKGKCAFSALLSEVAPEANEMVIDKLAASKKKPVKPDTDFVVEEDDGIWSVIGKPSKFVYSAHGSEAEAEKAKDEWLDAIPAKKKASLVERLATKIAADFMAAQGETADDDETADDEAV